MCRPEGGVEANDVGMVHHSLHILLVEYLHFLICIDHFLLKSTNERRVEKVKNIFLEKD